MWGPMTIIYLVLGVLALADAAVLLYLDRRRSVVSHHQRAAWGEQHGFKFRESDSKLRKVFVRAGMNVPEHVEVAAVAYGEYDGAEAVVFDLQETATVIAVRRSFPSRVVVDLRHEDVLAPAEDDVELLGAMGQRVMFSNNLDVARRVCDRRMVVLANTAPTYVEVLWNEGHWALGSLPLTDDGEELDTALEVVRRFADLLRVLPPLQGPQDTPDPRDPHGPSRPELADKKTEMLRDSERRARAEASRSESSRSAVAAPAEGRHGAGRHEAGRHDAGRGGDRHPGRPTTSPGIPVAGQQAHRRPPPVRPGLASNTSAPIAVPVTSTGARSGPRPQPIRAGDTGGRDTSGRDTGARDTVGVDPVDDAVAPPVPARPIPINRPGRRRQESE